MTMFPIAEKYIFLICYQLLIKIISEWNDEDQLSTEEDTKQFKVTEKRLLS